MESKNNLFLLPMADQVNFEEPNFHGIFDFFVLQFWDCKQKLNLLNLALEGAEHVSKSSETFSPAQKSYKNFLKLFLSNFNFS